MNWKKFLANPADRRILRQLQQLCAGREQLTDSEYHARFFQGSAVAEHTVAELRKLFALALGDIFSLIYPDDDWGKEFLPLWDLDSLADVELVMDMEELFDIEISEAEATAMTTLRKTAEMITAKLADKERATS